MKYLLKTILLIIFSSSTLLAQDEQEDSGPLATPDKPYEVVITGKPTKAYYRELIQQVEEDFFAKFNELNEDDAYDMYCYKYTPTMSHIRKRTCEPLFMIRQRAADGADIAFAFGVSGVIYGSNGAIGGQVNDSEEVRRSNRGRDYGVLVRKIEELTATNQELGEIASVMEQLKFRLENYSED